MPGTWSILVTLADGVVDTLIDLPSLSLVAVTELGAGAPELQIVAPADLFQRQRVRPRLITLSVESALRRAKLPAVRATLARYLTPDIGLPRTPLTLRYTLGATSYDILAYYAPKADDLGRGDAPIILRFVSFDPAWAAVTATTQSVGMLASLSLTSSQFILLRTAAGTWSAPSGGPTASVTALHYTPLTDYLYAATAVGAVWRWNGASWSQLGTSLGAQVRALLEGPDGTLYAGGDFTGYVKSWNGSAWATMGSIGGAVFSLALHSNALLYAGVDVSGYVKSWNGSAWSTVTSGLISVPSVLLLGPDSKLYACGNGFVRRLDSGPTWTALSGVGAWDIYAALFQPDGRLVVAGDLDEYAQIWNGVSWTGLDLDDIGRALLVGERGLHLFGDFAMAGGLQLWSSCAIRRGGTYFSFEIATDANRYVAAAGALSDGRMALALGGSSAGTIYIAKHESVTLTGSAAAYPTLMLTYAGVGAAPVYYVVNLTTGEELHFDGLTVLKGETVTIDCATATVASDYRGDRSSTVRAGSRPLRLLPYVENNLLLNGDTAITATLSYYPSYVTLDAIE